MSAADQSTTSDPTTRRRLLRLLGASGAALVATTLPLTSAEATHDPGAPDPDALHVGETNPAAATTTLEANLAGSEGDQAYTLVVTNESGRAGKFESRGTQALDVISHGGDECAFAGMFTAEDAFGLGAFSRGIGMKGQGTRGAFIGELLNEFAADDSPNAAVVGVAEASGVNCPPETPCTSPGSGVGVRGIAGAGTGVEGMSLAEEALIHVGDCAYQIPLWEPLAGPLGRGAGVLGRSGSGPGVKAESASGPAFEGSSESGPGAFVWSTTGPGVDATSGSGPGVVGWTPEGIAGVVGIGSINRGEGTPLQEARGVLGIASRWRARGPVRQRGPARPGHAPIRAGPGRRARARCRRQGPLLHCGRRHGATGPELGLRPQCVGDAEQPHLDHADQRSRSSPSPLGLAKRWVRLHGVLRGRVTRPAPGDRLHLPDRGAARVALAA